jgi:hypothetical protein
MSKSEYKRLCIQDPMRMADELAKLKEELAAAHQAGYNQCLKELVRVMEQFGIANQALANPPSLEAVERKKLEDEISVLEEASNELDGYYLQPLYRMIAERKAKLKEMK